MVLNCRYLNVRAVYCQVNVALVTMFLPLLRKVKQQLGALNAAGYKKIGLVTLQEVKKVVSSVCFRKSKTR